MGTHLGLSHPYHRATAGTAPQDSRAYGCRGSFHLIAACGLTAPYFRFGDRRFDLTHEITGFQGLRSSPVYSRMAVVSVNCLDPDVSQRRLAPKSRQLHGGRDAEAL